MPGPLYKPFPRRHNHDGTIDSICPECFRTVARCRSEAELDGHEHRHVCDPESIAELRLHRERLSDRNERSS